MGEETNNLKQQPQKWEGLVSAKLPPSIKPDQAWALLGDFCALDKFLPSVAACRKLEGPDGEPGCVRHCAGSPDPSTGTVFWAKEKLVEIDAGRRMYSYVITESNMGFGSYLATLRVVAGDGDQGGSSAVEWSFAAEPVPGWTRSSFVAYLEGGVKEMAKRIADALSVDGI